LIFLLAKDLPAYRGTCRLLLRDYRHTDDEGEILDVTWACSLAPDAVDEPDEVVRLAERGRAAQPEVWDQAENLGAALYRAGRYRAAVDELKAAIRLNGEGGTPATHFFLAMAHHGAGRAEEARACLDRALEKIRADERKAMAAGDSATRVDVVDRAIIRSLRREAEALIRPAE
jgi:tetratricopeptide (TPR) repeat protein